MSLDLKLELLKFGLFLFNILFLALGLSVAGCGIWICFDKENLLLIQTSVELSTVGFGLLMTGCVVIIAVVIGCIGTHGEQKVLLVTYLTLLSVLVLGQLFITLLLLVNRNQIEDNLDETFDSLIVQYGSHNGSSSRTDFLVDSIQIQMKCCGRTGPDDWQRNSYIIGLSLDESLEVRPCSCFSQFEEADQSPWCVEHQNASEHLLATEILPSVLAEVPLFGTGNSSYHQGCRQSLNAWLQENIVTIVGMDLGLLGVQVLQFVMVAYYIKTLGKKALSKRANQLIDPDPAHEDYDDTQVMNYETGPPTNLDHQFINYHNQ